MNELTALLRKNPNPTTVSLEYLNLTDVTSLLPRLARLPSLNTLFLHGNKLKSLPDMSALATVHTLDLTDNPFRSVRDILANLQSMPNLKVLNYSILPGKEDEEELLVVSLPNLTTLNGTSLVDEAASKETNTVTHESQSKLSKQPSSVSVAKPDGRGSPQDPALQPPAKNRSGVSFLLQQNEKGKGLSMKPTITMPSLGRLALGSNLAAESKPETPEETVKRLRAAHVPTSPSLFSPIITSLVNAQAAASPALTQDDIRSASGLFNAIKDIKANGSTEEEKRLNNAFDHHLKNVSNRLRERMGELQHDRSAQETEIIMAKHGLYDICFQEIIGLSDSINREVGQLLRKLRTSHTTLFHAFPHMLAASGQQASLLLVMRNDLIKAESEVQQLFDVVNLLDEEAERNHAEVLKLRSQLSEMQKRNEDMALAIAKSATEGGAAGRLIGMQTSGASSVRVSNKPKVLTMSGSFSTSAASNELSSTFSPVEAYAEESRSAVDSSSCRALLLTQVKDFIGQVYVSKEKADKRNAENELAKETLYQHFFLFLHQRYGLKPIIIENAASILMGVDSFSDEDNDVAVFGKILRNEIDEDFRHVQEQLKSTIVDLLRVHLKGRYPMKADTVVVGHLKSRMEGDICEEEWADIVKYMYNTEDAGALTMMLKEVIRQRLEPQVAAASSQRSTRSKMSNETQKSETALRQGKISFNDFQKILLDFQLHGHDRFLSRFREIFAAMDDDGDGIVNEEQFRNVVTQVNTTKTNEEVQQLLEKIDPFNHQCITFSQAVNFLSDDIVSMMLQISAGEPDLLGDNDVQQQAVQEPQPGSKSSPVTPMSSSSLGTSASEGQGVSHGRQASSRMPSSDSTTATRAAPRVK